MKLQAVKGTHDILPNEIPAWRHMRQVVRAVLERAGARELRTPVFEHTEVFLRSAGDSSDLVVQKEMYTFEDRGGRSLTLRPEFTAGTLRAFIQNGMHTLPVPVKLWSFGPVFRAENVQRGRYRQFHQVNYEVLGLDSPLIDAEAIALLHDVLRALGLRELKVRVGTVGDPQDRAAYNDYLLQTLGPIASQLTETSQERLRLNPLRILDAKDPGDRQLISGLKRPVDFLNPASRKHFEQVRNYLAAWEIPFEVDPGIVRGLDYYQRTAFEIDHGGIGALATLCGGGRYDSLVEDMGGVPTPGIGWAFGVERVLDAMKAEGIEIPAARGPFVYLVPLDDAAVGEVAAQARKLRRNLHAEFAYVKRNPGRGLRDADRAGASFAALRGSQERAAGIFLVKELATGEQQEIPEAGLEEFLNSAAGTTGKGKRES
jgi:histidyl-tRNA synthetase